MKTVKRKAEVGERIYDFNTGRTEVVKAVYDDHVTVAGYTKAFDAISLVAHKDYEVIIEDDGNELLASLFADEVEVGAIPPHSAHYHQTGTDPLEVMRQTFPAEQYEGFLRGNALKYIMRYPLKGTPVDDLEKAGEYVKMLLEYQRNPEGRTKVTLRNGQGEVIAEGYEEAAE